jgi:RNA 3'-terminal phosphate cyclase (ATP)
MIHIDGSQKSGSGTILRYSVSLATLLRNGLHITNIRARRRKPGLRPQHLRSVLACQQMCEGKVVGARVGAREITYRPGRQIRGGRYEFDIGTAGSTTMLAAQVLPLACFADQPTHLKISGGLFQDWAPNAFHMQHVLFPLLRRMGIQADLQIIRPGYVPRGGGVIEVVVRPVRGPLKPLRLIERGRVMKVEGVALSSHLQKRRVSERMAEVCGELLRKAGYEPEISVLYDTTAVQRGATLAVWAVTDTGCILGADRAGKLGRSSESIGEHVAKTLLADLATGATVDRFLADQLILYAALAQGKTEYVIPRMTEHVDTNLWLVEEILGVKTAVRDGRVQIEGVGYKKS